MINTDQQLDKTQQAKGRLMLLVLAIFFMVPIGVVMLMIKFNWHPQGSSYGDLLSPARKVTMPLGLSNSDGKTLDQVWNDKWSIVYIAKQCDSHCSKRLYDIRQIYVSLYKDMLRTQRVLITQQTELAEIKSAHPEMIIINQPDAAVKFLAETFNIGNENAFTAARVYFVDPRGHLVTSYQIQIEPKYIRKDLVKLLKSSWAG